MGTFGQASASSAVCPTLPRHALHTPWSLLLEKPPLKGEFSSLIILWVLGACTALLTHPGKARCRAVRVPTWLGCIAWAWPATLPHSGWRNSHTFMWCWLGFWQSVSNLLKRILRSLSKSIKVNHFFCPDYEVPGQNSQGIFTILESVCNTCKLLHEMGHFLFW